MGDGGISRIVRFGGPGGSSGGGGGGGGSFSGDATSIQTVPVNPTAPGDNAVLVKPAGSSEYVPSQLTQDQILPGFAILGFSHSGGLPLLEVGSTVGPYTFAASYQGGTPTTATLSDSDGNTRDVTSTPTAPVETATHHKTTNGATVTWTLTAVRSGITKTALLSQAWGHKVYYGGSASSGPYDAAFIAGLATSQLRTTRVNSPGYAMTWTAGQQGYICFLTGSTPTFKVGGFLTTLTKVATNVSVTSNGVTLGYDVYQYGPPATGSVSLTLEVTS